MIVMEKSVKLPAVLDLFQGAKLRFGLPKRASQLLEALTWIGRPWKQQNSICAEGKSITNSICINGDIQGIESVTSINAEEYCSRRSSMPIYSLAGRAKLRSLGEDRRHTKDKRGDL